MFTRGLNHTLFIRVEVVMGQSVCVCVRERWVKTNKEAAGFSAVVVPVNRCHVLLLSAGGAALNLNQNSLHILSCFSLTGFMFSTSCVCFRAIFSSGCIAISKL
ncbi:hypothetical protein AMECASPLE_029483 [Ameca splendens]|uniref:Uncharacterized protein n=1 Tax=Ameca splendens TaxID=208324 RepID=A0ABV0YSS9_9TELE